MGGLQHVTLCIVDDSMDTAGNFRINVNTWPERCGYCTFPDLDFVPSPYRLARGIHSSVELSVLDLGNLAVRQRVHDVLMLTVADQIDCYPTCHWRTREPTDWTVVSPRHIRPTVAVTPKPDIPRCPTCGEPRTAHGTHLISTGQQDLPTSVDIFKTKQWMSCEEVGEREGYYWRHVLKLKQPPIPREGVWTRISIMRAIMVSVRLFNLLKALKVVGLVAQYGLVPQATPEDQEWVRDKLALINAHVGTRPQSQDNSAWFDQFLALRKGRGLAPTALAKAEKRLGLRLPDSYVRLITQCGKQTFRNIEGEEGFDVKILTPAMLDASESWLTEPDSPTHDDSPAKPLLFGTTGHGDGFVFDVTEMVDGDYPVFLYRHEMHAYEPYAPSFAMCIKRLAGDGCG